MAQKSVSELPPAHLAALQEFLASHPELEFLSEKNSDQEVLKGMREDRGARFKPFYRSADFNRDGVQDFAVILVKNTPPKEEPGLADSHKFRHGVAVVVFNGMKGGAYKPAFVKNVSAPLVCFLDVMRERRGRLYFGVAETDEGFVMTPAGKGYIAEDLS